MSGIFDYDVFLSFTSKDEEAAKPVWQELSLSGLRVFWSDEALKQNVGQSFFEVVQESLINSRHFVLLMSANAADSEWVKLEYITFHNQCYLPAKGERRLVVYPIGGYDTARLPPFLKNLQIARSVKAIIPLLGGVDIQAIRRENAKLREQIETANDELQKLRDEASGLRRLNADIDKKLTDANRQIRDLKAAAAKAPSREKVESARPQSSHTPGESGGAGSDLVIMAAEKKSAEPEGARPPVVALLPPGGQHSEHIIGHVTNYFAKVGVAVVKLNNDLYFGARIRIKGRMTDFEQRVETMRVNDKGVLYAPRNAEVTIKMNSRCRTGDDVYIIE